MVLCSKWMSAFAPTHQITVGRYIVGLRALFRPPSPNQRQSAPERWRPSIQQDPPARAASPRFTSSRSTPSARALASVRGWFPESTLPADSADSVGTRAPPELATVARASSQRDAIPGAAEVLHRARPPGPQHNPRHVGTGASRLGHGHPVTPPGGGHTPPPGHISPRERGGASFA